MSRQFHSAYAGAATGNQLRGSSAGFNDGRRDPTLSYGISQLTVYWRVTRERSESPSVAIGGYRPSGTYPLPTQGIGLRPPGGFPPTGKFEFQVLGGLARRNLDR